MINTAWEQFQRAAVALAGSRPIKDRLTSAYRDHLSQVSMDDLPRELREEFRALGRALTRERPLLRGEDSLRATIRKISSEEAADIACSVVRLFSKLPRGGASAARPKTTAQIVPLHAAEA